MRTFLDALTMVVIVIVLVALPLAAINTHILKIRELILIIDLVVIAVFSAAWLVWGPTKSRPLFSRGDLKRNSKSEGEGSKNEEFCSNCGQHLMRIHSNAVAESILRNHEETGILDD